tara:strand:- start:2299 stop:2580 length:282 start_codon:yes stop_codon:yes gene_type:complete
MKEFFIDRASYGKTRTAVGEYLRLCEREFNLETTINHTRLEEFTADRKVGALAFTLASICYKHPEAHANLQKQIQNKQRAVAQLEARKTRYEK